MLTKTRKAPGALDPAVVLRPPGGVKYVTVTQDKSPWLCSERHDEYFFGRAKTGGLGQVTTTKKRTRKAPGALDPALVPPPPGGGVKYVTVTQDKSPWLCSERHDEYFFGRAKTGGLGQVTTKKQEKPQGHYPAVPPSPRGVKDIMVTQDTSSSLCSERRDKYVWPSKNRRSGASDHQKNGK